MKIFYQRLIAKIDSMKDNSFYQRLYNIEVALKLFAFCAVMGSAVYYVLFYKAEPAPKPWSQTQFTASPKPETPAPDGWPKADWEDKQRVENGQWPVNPVTIPLSSK